MKKTKKKHKKKAHPRLDKEKYPIDTKEVIENLQKGEAVVIPRLGELLHFEANFTPESLLHLEKRLAGFSEQGKKAILNSPPHFLTLAYYFGETLRRNIPGLKWHYEHIRDISLLSLRGKPHPSYKKAMGHEIRPVSRLMNFLQWPNKFGFYDLYEALAKVVHGKVVDLDRVGEQRHFYDVDGNYVFQMKGGLACTATDLP